MKKIIVFILLGLAISTSAQNQIILQFQEAEALKNVQNSKADLLLQGFQLSYLKQLSTSLNIYLFEFDTLKVKPSELINILQQNPTIKGAQLNSPISFRSPPNDSLFVEQWQYHNNGSTGIIDADIDALAAWEITKGGKSFDGQEIVVAIIDGGVNLKHPDLEKNIWRNINEIPDNGIDDDHNNFIDDYFGWNFIENTNDVSNEGNGHWHGTPVAGIIGARGDNEIGVSGVNWDIKMMNLVANQNIADIIAAYDYVYQMRKKFNESNGREGAFIVATNTSLGVDYGNPLDYPIWCEMFNLLGQEGVLSVAATANKSIDVSIEGDMPTTCTSEFLISVTNTTSRDQKESFAAYGLTHIDLGAPGTSVFTAKNSGDYGRFGGTSAATPHVAGAVALLYAAPIESLILDVGQDPVEVALNMKQYLLDGTDKIEDLENRTVSGGRLNLYNSLVELQKYYQQDLQEVIFKEIIVNRVFPNPTREHINIDFEIGTTVNLELKIYNSLGQLMDQYSMTQLDKGKHQLKYSLKDLEAGIYYVLLTDEQEEHRTASKIIVY